MLSKEKAHFSTHLKILGELGRYYGRHACSLAHACWAKQLLVIVVRQTADIIGPACTAGCMYLGKDLWDGWSELTLLIGLCYKSRFCSHVSSLDCLDVVF